MRLLITGGSSYLGQHLVPLALRGEYEVFYTFYSHDPLSLPQGQYLDVRDETAVHALVDALRPHVIVHTAGSNRPAATMDAVIRRGAAHITEAAAACAARLVHISTDVVFDGREAPYREADAPAPLHDYGRAKAAAERLVSQHPDHVIVRTSLIYGLEKMDRGTAWIRDALRASQPVTLFTDQVRNPVWAISLSQACLELASLDCVGVLHVAGGQRLSRAEFALRMLDWWGVEGRGALRFGRCDADRWPLDCTLHTGRARALLQTPLPGVDTVLATRGARLTSR